MTPRPGALGLPSVIHRWSKQLLPVRMRWGRIVMAVGKSGERVDRDRLSIEIGGHKVARRGRAVPGYDETPVARHMQGQRIHIAVDVGAADGKAKGRTRIWASDLTHGYISINADYRS